MKNNEKKILIIAICCIALIGAAAYFFTEPSIASHKGNGQGRVLASQYSSVNAEESRGGWNRQNSNCPENCEEHADDCTGDCDNCDEDQKNFKNRAPENGTKVNTEGKNQNQEDREQPNKASSGQGIWMYSQETQGQGSQQGSGQGKGIGRKDGRGCRGNEGCCP